MGDWQHLGVSCRVYLLSRGLTAQLHFALGIFVALQAVRGPRELEGL